MEETAIAILVMVLLVGAVTFFIFFQFLATVRENHKLFKQIMDEIQSLKRQVTRENASSPIKDDEEKDQDE
jgi:cytoskeletal protein RodZ